MRQSRILSHGEIHDPGQALGVGDIEDVPAKGELLSFPWHLERLGKPEVQAKVAGETQIISRPTLAWVRAAKTLINSSYVASPKNLRSSIFGLVGAGVD